MRCVCVRKCTPFNSQPDVIASRAFEKHPTLKVQKIMQFHLFAFLAEGGFAGVATQVITLSAGDLLCGRLQDGWHRGADRPNIAVLSMCAILTLFWSFLTLMGLPSTLDVRQIAKTIVGLPVSWCPFDGVPILREGNLHLPARVKFRSCLRFGTQDSRILRACDNAVPMQDQIM